MARVVESTKENYISKDKTWGEKGRTYQNGFKKNRNSSKRGCKWSEFKLDTAWGQKQDWLGHTLQPSYFIMVCGHFLSNVTWPKCKGASSTWRKLKYSIATLQGECNHTWWQQRSLTCSRQAAKTLPSVMEGGWSQSSVSTLFHCYLKFLHEEEKRALC